MFDFKFGESFTSIFAISSTCSCLKVKILCKRLVFKAMAMAEVYRPESEDRLSPYPRAPPPSPEAQHRTLGGIFEFPRGMFEDGFGIDLRRRDFDFSETDELTSPVREPTTVRRSSPKRAASSDTDDSDFEQPGSPMKRMCSAPSTMPSSFEVQGFQPSLLSSSTSVGNGSLLQPVSTGDMKVSIPNFSELAAFKSRSPEHAQSHSHSTSPPLFQQQHQTTSPYSIPPRSNGSVTPTHQPLSQEHYDTSHLLSKSFDLHNVQSHFPAHFEVTPPPPEVRPTRSRTLDTTSYTDNPALRTRKVSLKRNYNELESTEPNLQFPFDYSYSSTGSSGESDWVVIENDLSSCPQGKKACCQPEPLSSAAAVAMSKRRSANLTANTGSPLHHPQATNTTSTSSHISPFNTALRSSSNGVGQDNTLLRSQESTTTTPVTATQQLQHLGQSSSAPLGVLSSNTGADLSSFPGGSAASNGSGSHSPLHTQLGMIHESIGVGSSAELHNASSAGYGHMPTADAALAERSHHVGELMPQWSMEMMDCGEYSTRLDSLDSMDCGMVNDAPATMQSISEEPNGDLNEALLFTNNYSLQPQAQQQMAQQQQQQNHQYQHGGLLNPGYTPQVVHNPTSGPIVRSQSSEASTTSASSTTQKPTRHSFIENYFVSYHQSNNMTGGGGTIAGGGQQNVDSSTVSKSL